MAAAGFVRPLSCTQLPMRPNRATSRKRTNAPASVAPAASLPLKKALVPVGLGTEEMEAVILIDVLRRAGCDVVVASVEPELEVEASAGTKIIADAAIAACADQIFDLVVLPGGMPGATRLRDCNILRSITCKQAEEKKLYGAICASPAVVLEPWGLLKRKKMTGHPAFMHKLPTFWAVTSNVQVSGEVTTSRGPGTALEFALSFVEQLFGRVLAEEIGGTMLMCTDDGHPRQEEFNGVEWSFNHTPTVLVPVANGSEEMEVVTIVDILRRAKVEVVIASVEKSLAVVASQKTKIIADKSIGIASKSVYDMIILPGGVAGTERLYKSKALNKLLTEQVSSGRICGAMCSSPTILQRQGLLQDTKTTAHPSVINKLTHPAADGTGVVIDGKVITGKGLATAIDFALAIVTKFFGRARARSVAEGIVFSYPKS